MMTDRIKPFAWFEDDDGYVVTYSDNELDDEAKDGMRPLFTHAQLREACVTVAMEVVLEKNPNITRIINRVIGEE